MALALDPLLEIANNAHLLPLIFLFVFLGILLVVAMGVKCTCRCVAEIWEDFCELRARVAASKARCEETIKAFRTCPPYESLGQVPKNTFLHDR